MRVAEWLFENLGPMGVGGLIISLTFVVTVGYAKWWAWRDRARTRRFMRLRVQKEAQAVRFTRE